MKQKLKRSALYVYKLLPIILLTIILLVTVGISRELENILRELQSVNGNLRTQNLYLETISNKECKVYVNQITPTSNTKETKEVAESKKQKPMIFMATAYDNSVESQGQWVGKTATGYSLTGKSLDEARTIAVDPKIIPLNSKVKITFDEQYKHLNGVYYARDTGGAIKGYKIDVFMGDGVSKQVSRNFGKREVRIEIVERGAS